ncbi:hypothetical protein Hamer_G019878 [Homarus americanus]|uniref:Uncharacterized protein n=1 Tax=Homarus americanus TaxID=6706 RepID=A0A8J5JYU5_HOMAM|nr:hypothetical protein Hamer_G019878 [Homarus americanus]
MIPHATNLTVRASILTLPYEVDDVVNFCESPISSQCGQIKAQGLSATYRHHSPRFVIMFLSDASSLLHCIADDHHLASKCHVLILSVISEARYMGVRWTWV